MKKLLLPAILLLFVLCSYCLISAQTFPLLNNIIAVNAVEYNPVGVNKDDFTWYQDMDGDGYGNPEVSTTTTTNTAPDGYVADNTDCDDGNAAFHPGAVWYKDTDDDYYSDGATVVACIAPYGYKTATELVGLNNDCNDDDFLLNPATVWYLDSDFDGYSDGTSYTQCEKPGPPSNNVFKMAGSLLATSGDCNDSDPSIYPDAGEICGNGIDENCNGMDDDACDEGDSDGDGTPNADDCAPNDATKWRSAEMYKDSDSDGYYVSVGVICYGAEVPEGYTLDGYGTDDCDDNDNYVYVSYDFYIDNDGDGLGSDQTAEVCVRYREYPPDGYSNYTGDCDDNNSAVQYTHPFYVDADGDGYGAIDGYTELCTADASTPPPGYAMMEGDCNDTDALIHPNAAEVCGNNVDDNCDGQIDEGCNFENDGDGDGYKPSDGDCNDSDASISPGVSEVCFNGIDDNCNGETDEGCNFENDFDGDGYLPSQGDCNDGDPSVNPGVAEVCGNGIDDNCNGETDEGCALFTWYRDSDGDGYGTPNESITTPTDGAPSGYVNNNTDCDDYDSFVYPGIWYLDFDLDGYGRGYTAEQCERPTFPSGGYWKRDFQLYSTDGDCNDENASINPDADEICGNGIDENCNGLIDEDCPKYTWYVDADGDGYGNPGWQVDTDDEIPPEGCVSNNDDCNDNNAAINPTTVWYVDNDKDGYSNGTTVIACNPKANGSTSYFRLATELMSLNGDCNDGNPAINPGAAELCGNNIDDDCDGNIDEDCASNCGGQIGVLYVNQSAPNSGNGSGWACAIKELRDAVTVANGNTAITQIWVAKGTYKATSLNNRNASITVSRANLKILGGFAGTETSATAASPTTNITTISGDIGVANNPADNSYHMLQVTGVPSSAKGLQIDGFSFEKGNANDPNTTTSNNAFGGAAIFYNNAAATPILISRSGFTGNTSSGGGGAVGVYQGNVRFDSCLFTGNSSANGGAAATYEAATRFSTCIFRQNSATAGSGGAMLIYIGGPSFTGTAFDRNTATISGGAVAQEQGGAVYKQCVFSGNSSATGGGVYQRTGGSSQLINSTFFGNIASTTGGAVAFEGDGSKITARNSIFWKNKAGTLTNVAGADIAPLAGSGASSYNNNVLQPNSSVPADNGGTISSNMRGVDPLFVNENSPYGADGWFIAFNDGLELKNTSPAKNVGNNTYAAGLSADIQGKPRIACATADLGAYENQLCPTLISKSDLLIKDEITTTIKASVTNPFTNSLLIRYTGAEKAEVDITTFTGQKVWKGSAIQKGQTQVNTASWPSGLYQVTIRTATSKPIVLKVVKTQ